MLPAGTALDGVNVPNILGGNSIAAALTLLARLRAIDERGRLTPSGRDMQRLPLHPRLARLMLAARGSQEAAAACADGTIHIWNLPTVSKAKERAILPAVGGAVHSVAFTKDGATLAAGWDPHAGARSSNAAAARIQRPPAGEAFIEVANRASYTCDRLVLGPWRVITVRTAWRCDRWQ